MIDPEDLETMDDLATALDAAADLFVVMIENSTSAQEEKYWRGRSFTVRALYAQVVARRTLHANPEE